MMNSLIDRQVIWIGNELFILLKIKLGFKDIKEQNPKIVLLVVVVQVVVVVYCIGIS